jgi:divalent metal cation (Fe/Co/Zn/Cd) transporter
MHRWPNAVGGCDHRSIDVVAHRHGAREHAHPFRPGHRHLTMPGAAVVDDGHPHHHHHHDDHSHDHSHGLVHDSIKRSRDGVRTVLIAFGVLGIGAVAQTLVYVASGSVALLADLIHNFGDALTAVPLGVAFAARSPRAERAAGLFVVAAIFISACLAGAEAVSRLIDPSRPGHLWAVAAAGAIGVAANALAARVRSRAGRRLDSPALIADGDHARADAYVSLAVIASAAVIAAGAPIADPLIGLAITVVILRITLASWRTIVSGVTDQPGDT